MWSSEQAAAKACVIIWGCSMVPTAEKAGCKERPVAHAPILGNRILNPAIWRTSSLLREQEQELNAPHGFVVQTQNKIPGLTVDDCWIERWAKMG